MLRVPTYLDRYPAKMVTRLANDLTEKYTKGCSRLLDPFCGSGAILLAAKNRKLPITGWDINPYAVLLSRVKLEGFNKTLALDMCASFLRSGKFSTNTFPVDWESKYYWFTKSTIVKYERLRYVAAQMNLWQTPEGRAILLAFALSIRKCSKADQRSPKPFISKQSLIQRKGKHFDPIKQILFLLEQLCFMYSSSQRCASDVKCVNVISLNKSKSLAEKFSHIITSPPYINAQDYFRNSKLELYLLEGVLPFYVDDLIHQFVGTERGDLIQNLSNKDMEANRNVLPELKKIEITHPRRAAIVHRYFYDMNKCFETMKFCLQRGGVLVIVGGDNLVGGYPIPTWKLLNTLLEKHGFIMFDTYGDIIDCRNVPPKRKGHQGIIKQEVVSAFRLS